ncbi:MAG: GNAT family N-acetyltransferase [Thermoanaerobaculia bacterium]|nr:GNAT family N-acetyltransferase [Thermoanaerobaculia bacterium]
MSRATQTVEAVVPYVTLVPSQRRVGRLDVCLRPMESDDIERMLAFGRSLSDREILVLRMNLRRRKSIEEWIASIERGRRLTLIIESGDAILGYGGISLRGLRWYRHIGDIRLVVHPDHRKAGLGGMLIEELVDIGRRLGLNRLIAQIPRSQTGAAAFFRRFGFHQQVLLPDWVIDGDGQTQDLLILTRDL